MLRLLTSGHLPRGQIITPAAAGAHNWELGSGWTRIPGNPGANRAFDGIIVALKPSRYGTQGVAYRTSSAPNGIGENEDTWPFLHDTFDDFDATGIHGEVTFEYSAERHEPTAVTAIVIFHRLSSDDDPERALIFWDEVAGGDGTSITVADQNPTVHRDDQLAEDTILLVYSNQPITIDPTTISFKMFWEMPS